MANILSRLGAGLSGFGAGVQDPSFAIKEARRREEEQQRQQLGQILSGQSTPAFLRAGGAEGTTPEQRQQFQLSQLAALGTPAATDILTKLSPLGQKPATPLSTVGKIQSDITRGLITPEAGIAAIKKATRPAAPLVQIGSSAKASTRKSRDQLQSGINAADKLIAELEKAPTKGGVLGAARGAFETGAGVVGDIAGSIPGFEGVKESLTGVLPTIGDSVKGLSPLQNQLALGLARSRQGDEGRILADNLKQSKQDTNIGGLTSSQQVLDSLRKVKEELQTSLGNLVGRAGEAGFDLPVGSKRNVIKLDENFNVVQ